MQRPERLVCMVASVPAKTAHKNQRAPARLILTQTSLVVMLTQSFRAND